MYSIKSNIFCDFSIFLGCLTNIRGHRAITGHHSSSSMIFLSHGCVAYLFITEICMMYSKTLRSILRKPRKSSCNLRKWSWRHKMCNIHALCVFVYSKEIFLQSEAKSRLAAQIAAKFDWRSPNRSASGENRPRPSFLNTINQVYILQVTLKWGLKSSLLVRPILV